MTVDEQRVAEPVAALAEPATPVRARWVSLLFLANLAVWMGFFTPIQVLLPNQIQEIVGEGQKEAMLGWVTGIGALAALVVNPLAGALSDRTTSRFGRRHPWTLSGGLIGAAGLVLLAQQQTVVGVALTWVGVQICFNAMLASLTAALPDRVPVSQRAAISGWVGMPQVLGVVIGTILVTAVFTTTRSGYLAVAVAVVLLTVAFPLLTPDDRLPREHRPRVNLRAFWVSPRRYPDFAWVFATRFLVQLGNSMATLFLLYFLGDEVLAGDAGGFGRGVLAELVTAMGMQTEAEAGLLVLILVYTAGIIATTVVAGRLSDRSGRRKPFVIVAGLVMAVAAVLLALWPTWPVAMLAALVLGAGYGVYVAVDQALITQVLPAAAGRAKDLGIVNIANSAPQVLGPAIAAPIVAVLGGYPVLYLATAVVTVLGGVFVYRVRAVR